MLTLSRRDAVIVVATLLLMAIAIVRVAVPDRSRIRPLSIESFEVTKAQVDPGQTVTREATWSPQTDVYVMGWNPWIGAPTEARFDADLMMYQPDSHTTLFVMGQRVIPPGPVDTWREVDLPPGTGFLVRKEQPVAFRYRITNTGPTSFETGGATALLYFVPVEGN